MMRLKVLLLQALVAGQIIAQDTLWLVNGTAVPARVSTITMSHIVYRDSATAQKDKAMPKSNVRYLTYSSGQYEVISLKNISPAEINISFRKGQQDATANYTGKSCGAVGTGVTSFLTGGIIGLVPAIACSATRPKTLNLGLPRGAPVSDKSYMLGYVTTAKAAKQKKVWTGYAVGFISAITFLLVVR